MVRRRIVREPVAYILGRKGFRRIELAVDPRALIPRPETELLVERSRAANLKGARPLTGPRRRHRVGRGRARGRRRAARGRGSSPPTPPPGRCGSRRRTPSGSGSPTGSRFELGSLPAGRTLRSARRQPALRERGRVGGARARDHALRAALGARARAERAGGDRGDARRALARAAARPPRSRSRSAPARLTTVAELVRRAGFDSVETRRDLAGIERVVLGSNT